MKVQYTYDGITSGPFEGQTLMSIEGILRTSHVVAVNVEYADNIHKASYKVAPEPCMVEPRVPRQGDTYWSSSAQTWLVAAGDFAEHVCLVKVKA